MVKAQGEGKEKEQQKRIEEGNSMDTEGNTYMQVRYHQENNASGC